MSHGPLLRALRELGVVGTFRELYSYRTIKFGALVGVDAAGNKYYENTVDYPYGQHRWVHYAGGADFYAADGSNVPPEWHSWLHHIVAEPPTEVRRRAVVRRRLSLARAARLGAQEEEDGPPGGVGVAAGAAP